MKYSRTWSNLVHTANFDTRLARMLIRPLSLPWRGSESAQSRSLGWRTAVKMRHEASRSYRQTLRITIRYPGFEHSYQNVFMNPEKRRSTNHPASSDCPNLSHAFLSLFRPGLHVPTASKSSGDHWSDSQVRPRRASRSSCGNEPAGVSTFESFFQFFPWTDVCM